jgi:exosortase/archaeosortase family protein
LKLLGVYGFWKLFYLAVDADLMGLYSLWQSLTSVIAEIYTSCSVQILNMLHIKAEQRSASIVLSESLKIVLIKEHCLAIPAMVIFVGSVLSFPGSKLEKTWFIIAGLGGIFVINLTRLVFVAVAFQYFSKSVFNFNHSVLYVILTYTFIFSMLVWWMEREEKRAMSED